MNDNIRAATPLGLGFIGGFIAVAAMFSPNVDSNARAQGLGVSAAFAAGAAGLAQQSAPQNQSQEIIMDKDKS